MRAATAYIALGSNLGDREQSLKDAITALNQHPQVEVKQLSNIYETDPVGFTDQPAFLNMVIRVSTVLLAMDLLSVQFSVEEQLGRKRELRWGPRTIDLDLLMYDNVSMKTDRLILPHPRMMERAFVLVPLHDVLDKEHSQYNGIGQFSKEALRLRKEGISLWKTISWLDE